MQIQNTGQNTGAAGHLPPQARAIQPGLLPPPSVMRPQPRPQAPAPSQRPDVSDIPLSARIAAKRRHEEAAHEPGDHTCDKKAKSTGQPERSQPTVKLEVEDAAAPQRAEPVPEIPQTLVDPLDALLTLGLQAQRPAARVEADDLPMLEPSAPVARIETKSARQPPAQASAGADLLRQARDPQPLLGLSPETARTAGAVRTQMFEEWAGGLPPDQRLDAFRHAGKELPGHETHTPSQCARWMLLRLELEALAKHLLPQQHQAVLDAAKDPGPYLGIADNAPPRVIRRLKLEALYRSMSPANRETEADAARSTAGLLNLSDKDFRAVAVQRSDQFIALASLRTHDELQGDQAKLRRAGVALASDGVPAQRAAALARSLQRAVLTTMCGHQRATAFITALEMTPALQALTAATWRATLKHRRGEFTVHAKLMSAAERLEVLGEALHPGNLGAPNDPTRMRAVELHTALLSGVLQGMKPEELDAALARLKAPQALGTLSGPARQMALLLRKEAFHAWFAAWEKNLPSPANPLAPVQ